MEEQEISLVASLGEARLSALTRWRCSPVLACPASVPFGEEDKF